MTVETFMRRSTTVSSLTDAFAFVMDEVDKFDRPAIEIRPFKTYTLNDLDGLENGEGGRELIEVTVSGSPAGSGAGGTDAGT